MHEPLDLTPLVRKKSIRGSFSVPPRASYYGHKINNSMSPFQPGRPVRNTSLLTGPIKEIQTLRIYGSLVQMSCSLVSRWVLLSIQWDLGQCGGGAVTAVNVSEGWGCIIGTAVSCSNPAAESLQKGEQRRGNASFTF